MNITHHLCLYEAYSVFDGKVLPYGTLAVEATLTETISTLLDDIVPLIGNGQVIVCGADPSRRMVGRKLEDRLQREVKYE